MFSSLSLLLLFEAFLYFYYSKNIIIISKDTYFFWIFSFPFCFCWTCLRSSHLHCIFSISIDTSRSSSSSYNLLWHCLISWDTSWSKTMRRILCNTHITFITHWQRSCTSWSSCSNICGLGWYLHIALSLLIFLSVWYDTFAYFELVHIIEIKNVRVIIICVNILI